MICSFDFCLNRRFYSEEQKNDLIENVLENVKRSIDSNGEISSISGNVDNYRVTILQEKIFFNGSLPKLYLGSNVGDLTKDKIPQALKYLKKRTKMPIQFADVIRIDFAVNVILKDRYKMYLPYFGETHGYTKGRDQFGGVKYGKIGANQKIEIAIYDKLAELAANDREVYKIAKDVLKVNGEKCIMRIEMRIKKSVRKTLLPNSSRFTLVHLLSTKVNQKLIRLWNQHYEAIDKKMNIRLPSEISGLKELKDLLAAKQIESEGLDQVMLDIEEMAKKGKWSSKKKSIIKKEIKKLSQVRFEGKLPPAMMEIENKIKRDSPLKKWISDWGL